MRYILEELDEAQSRHRQAAEVLNCGICAMSSRRTRTGCVPPSWRCGTTTRRSRPKRGQDLRPDAMPDRDEVGQALNRMLCARIRCPRGRRRKETKGRILIIAGSREVLERPCWAAPQRCVPARQAADCDVGASRAGCGGDARSDGGAASEHRNGDFAGPPCLGRGPRGRMRFVRDPECSRATPAGAWPAPDQIPAALRSTRLSSSMASRRAIEQLAAAAAPRRELASLLDCERGIEPTNRLRPAAATAIARWCCQGSQVKSSTPTGAPGPFAVAHRGLAFREAATYSRGLSVGCWRAARTR